MAQLICTLRCADRIAIIDYALGVACARILDLPVLAREF